MKIATWNINGINSRLDQVIKWSGMAEPDVLCLQETKTPDAKFPLMKLRKAGYEHIAVHGEKSYNGVAILSRLPMDDIVAGFPKTPEGEPTRVIAATINARAVPAFSVSDARSDVPASTSRTESRRIPKVAGSSQGLRAA